MIIPSGWFNLNKDSGTDQCIKEVFNERQGIMILESYRVARAIVSDTAKVSVLLFDKEHCSIIWQV